MRFRHQTQHAAKAVRTQGSAAITNADSSHTKPNTLEDTAGPDGQKKRTSVRCQLIKEFHAILKEQQDKGAGSGLERVARWRSEGNAMGDESATVTGNAANAASAAKQVAKTVRSDWL
jgi:hypothetical protein